MVRKCSYSLINPHWAGAILNLVAGVSIFLLTLTVMVPALQSKIITNGDTLQRQALYAAQKVTATLRSAGVRSLPSNGSEIRSVTIGDTTFDVKITFCTRRSFCSPNVRQLHLEILHLRQNVYDTDTVVSDLA